MHDIEPYWKWRDQYTAEHDKHSPFYGREYNEFQFSHTCYNYYIHPQWDNFGSPTLFVKILFADYAQRFAVIELIGEWNDLINNDIMLLKDEVLSTLINFGINKLVFIGENVLNFHGDEDDYYLELSSEISDMGGWLLFLNFQEHVEHEMNESINLQDLAIFFQNHEWRKWTPQRFFSFIEIQLSSKMLS